MSRNKLNKIVLICPYFGKLPKGQFKLWLKSCEYNSTINWLIFTNDNTKYNYPKNVKAIYISFEKFQQLIQKKFAFKINISNPYKLCDFKPAYGYIFYDLIKEYDYWGYCDISDTIFGDLRKFLTTKNLTCADKVMDLGHFTLFKNDIEINKRFMKINDKYDVSDILGVDENKYFDEYPEYGINRIFLDNGYKINIIKNFCVDISPRTSSFHVNIVDENYNFIDPDNITRIFKWDEGKLYSYKIANDNIVINEIGYVHFQKRRMKIKISENSSSFMIVPNKFIRSPKVVSKGYIKFYSINYFFNLPLINVYIKRIQNKLKKIINNI